MKFIESIVKFSGNIEKISESVKSKVEILNNDLAIFKTDLDNFKLLTNCSQIQKIESSCFISVCSEQNSNLSFICKSNDKSFENLTGKGVIVSILDSGIDIYHPDFIDDDGNSRILYIWDQNKNGNPPEGFDFGTEYTNSEINMAIKGDIDIPNLDVNGHGTAVAGIASGNGRGSNRKIIGVAPESNIIVVKLLTENNSLSTRSTNLLRAVKYISEKAQLLQMPVVINISYGTNRGTHDGESLFEQYLDYISEQENVSIVVATGNEGISNHHFKYKIKTGETVNIEFSIGENFSEFSFVFVSSFYDYLTFRLSNSTGEQSSVIDLRQSGKQSIFFSKVRIDLYLDQPTPIYEGQQILIVLSSIEGYIPKDVWTLEVNGKIVLDGRIDSWLPITSIVGLETQFLNPSSETTLTLPSTSHKVISVGGYDTNTNEVTGFSGKGYTRDNFVAPDLVAPATFIPAPSTGKSYSNFTGTSFAAPFVSGACALMMQWGIVNKNDESMYGQRLKAFLKLGAKRKSGVSFPNSSWGYGSLCLKDSLDYAKKYASIKNPQELFSRDYFQFQIPENILDNYENQNDFNPVTNPNYLDFVINYDKNTSSIIEQDSSIKISKILREKFAIIHIPIESYMKNLSEYVLFEKSMICGLAQDFLESSGISAVQNQQFLQLKGSGVIVGIIDTGIDFNNECFKYEDGKSKILYLWDQGSLNGDPPEGFIYGTEYNNDQINNMMSENYNISDVDEIGHGTFISSIIAGRPSHNNNFSGAAPDSDIIFVKLKKAKKIMKEDSSIYTDVPCYESTDIMTGIEYILSISSKLGKPVVINIPLQTNEGSHDGLSFFEQYISSITDITGTAIVIPVGNQANKSGHTQFRIKQGESYKVEFNIATREPGFEINIWTSVPDRVSVSISTPLGNVIERRQFTINEYLEYDFVLEKSKIKIQYIFPDIKNGNQNIVIKFMNPTPGLWNLTVFGDLIFYGIIDLWMPISQFLTQGTALLNPTLDGTITTPSIAENIIAVGSYDSVDDSIYLPSGRGLNYTGRTKPNFVAPGVEISGIYPKNLEGTMTGTGVSSAIVAGASALLLEWGIVNKNDPKMNTTRIRSYLILGCSQSYNIDYPNNLWGYGKINLIESFRKIR